jgi:hypothetical protein
MLLKVNIKRAFDWASVEDEELRKRFRRKRFSRRLSLSRLDHGQLA